MSLNYGFACMNIRSPNLQIRQIVIEVRQKRRQRDEQNNDREIMKVFIVFDAQQEALLLIDSGL